MTPSTNHEPAPRRRRHRRVAGYVAATLMLPALVAGWSLTTTFAPRPADAAATSFPVPDPPAHDPDRLTAVVVAGATGAESLDVLAPYEVLAASGRFNVLTLAPTRQPLPLFPGSPDLHAVDLIAHHTFDSFDRDVGTADLVVLPYVPGALDPANEPLLAWLREQVTDDTILLTICGGSWVAADAGLLAGGEATTHSNLFDRLARQHPDVGWLRDQRWVEDGSVISSGGISAAIDATLRAIEKLVGRDVAERTAAELGYPHLRLLDDPTFTVPTAGKSTRALNAAFRPDRATLGVALYDGVSEIETASIVDLYPRTRASTIDAIGVTPGPITTRHGLHLAPRRHLTAGGGSPGRLLVPGTPSDDVDDVITTWASEHGVATDHVHRSSRTFAFDAVLADIARHESRAAAKLVATGIEYPLETDALEGRRWPYELVVRLLALGSTGLLAAVMVHRRKDRRRARTLVSQAPTGEVMTR